MLPLQSIRGLGAAVGFTLICADYVSAQSTASCSKTVELGLPTPSVAPGYSVNVVADGFEYPRSIRFDSAGHLLVVDSNVGIYHLGLNDAGDGCVVQSKRTPVVMDSELNHGIEFSMDGKTLYASTPKNVYAYPYDPETATAMVSQRTLVITNMTTAHHTTRTLLVSKKVPGMIMVATGSTANIDTQASDITTGHSQLKAFNLKNQTGTYDFIKDGILLGWGLRNDVGFAEEPIMGGIYSVENSVDDMSRMGKDIHENNPGEEMNYFGTLSSNTSPNQGGNFGYPECYSAWKVGDIPMNQGLEVGMQFAIGSDGITRRDMTCRQDRIAPRMVFQAHMAPLDIKFNTEGTEAWVTFHGSWDRTNPAGYKVSMIRFANGEPVEPSTSMRGAVDIISNPDNSACPGNCFRPVGLAFDPYGRLFFSSDETGQIFVITKNSGNNGAIDQNVPPSGTVPTTPAQTGSTGAASHITHCMVSVLTIAAGVVFYLL